MAKFLFSPLALSVVFAIAASLVLAMTLIPASVSRLLRRGTQDAGKHGASPGPLGRILRRFGFQRLTERYERALRQALQARRRTLIGAVLFLAAAHS